MSGEGIHIGKEERNGLSGLWTSNVVEVFFEVESFLQVILFFFFFFILHPVFKDAFFSPLRLSFPCKTQSFEEFSFSLRL